MSSLSVRLLLDKTNFNLKSYVSIFEVFTDLVKVLEHSCEEKMLNFLEKNVARPKLKTASFNLELQIHFRFLYIFEFFFLHK